MSGWWATSRQYADAW